MITPTFQHVPNNEIVWTTKEGQGLTLGEISNSHLCNIIRMLTRKRLRDLEDGYSLLSFFQGEMAIDSIEHEIEMVQLRYNDALDLFRGEAKRRHIPPSQYQQAF